MNEAAALGAASRAALPARLSSDDRLLRRAVQGDEHAFAAIFRRYHQDLYRYCLAILGNPEDAQDALQSSMVKALRALPGESRHVELRPWLYRVAHNEAIDLIRRRRASEPLDAERMADGPDLAREAETRERLAHLIADLETLPERQRGALVMRELSGLEFDEIGAALGTSGAVARQAVYEARLSLHAIEAGREMDCAAITKAVSDGDRRVLRRREIRAHLRGCPSCRAFREEIDGRSRDLAALSPLPAAALAGLLQSVFGAGGGGAGGGGLGAGLAGGAAKGLVGSTALKATATVAVVAAIGGAAADRAHLVDLGVPGGSAPPPASEEAADNGSGATGEAADPALSGPASGAAATRGHRVAEAGVGGQRPLAGRGEVPVDASADPAGGNGAHPDAAAKGQQTAAINRSKAHGSARAQEARATRGPRSSHPAHPAHPAKAPSHGSGNQGGARNGSSPPGKGSGASVKSEKAATDTAKAKPTAPAAAQEP